MANNRGNKRGLEQDGDDEAPDAKRIRDNDGNVILVQISPDEELEPIPKPGEPKPARPIKALPKKRLRGAINPRNPEPKTVPQDPGAQTSSPELQIPNTAAKPKATAEPLVAWKANRDFRTQKEDRYPSPGARQKSIIRDPFWGAGEPVGRPSRATPAEEAAWLASEPNWETRVGDAWRGTKVLGYGGFGMIGLWERDDKTKKPNKVVVKQQWKKLDSMNREAEFMKSLDGRGSHAVKIFKHVFSEKGQGTVKEFDEKEMAVGRIMMEYCEGGDLAGFIRNMYRKYSAQNPMPERLIWQIIKCTALCLALLENGNELPEGGEVWPAAKYKELVHFDIKPDNIFLGNNDNDHLETPVLKVAYFGVAMEVQKLNAETEFYIMNSIRIRGTRSYLSPEMNFRGWKIRGLQGKDWSEVKSWSSCRYVGNGITRELFRVAVRPDRDPILTTGKDLLNAPYSRSLRQVIFQCLAYDYTERPTPRQLLKYAEDALAASDPVGVEDGLGPGSFDEPGDLDPSWFSGIALPPAATPEASVKVEDATQGVQDLWIYSDLGIERLFDPTQETFDTGSGSGS